MFKLTVVVILVALGATLCSAEAQEPNGRIIGGHETTIKEHPYQLALYFGGRFICGAVLIGHRWAITTAHCIEGWSLKALTVRAGSSRVSGGGQLAFVHDVIVHQLYNRRTLEYNYALLHLRTSIAVRDARPAKLPNSNRAIHPGEWLIISGWGRTTAVDEFYPDHLQAAEVPVVDTDVCRNAYEGYLITESMFCGGILGIEGTDASHGDRGGPVVADGELVGLISWAINHGSLLRPDVFASIPAARVWIHAMTGI